jgi:topoisomerase-4 subunit A
MEDNLNELEEQNEELPSGVKQRAVSGMYEDWFLDYASYVILERAVPAIEDGLKPVQRRILHSMKELDDGRYNKVANLIGHTMQYHPHGDAAIGDAVVNMGQKDLLIDPQGNWGDIRTGDSAAAARYIEARLTKFALEILFNEETTRWQRSYDGRKKEPITLPVKFPLVLAQGVEGIAVGLSTKILPHNFIELIKASIDILKGKKSDVKPDFPTGGYADFTDYNEGRRGGRVKVRAKLEEKDKKTLLVKDLPFGVTTGSLIDSILKANDKGKIKIKKVIDNTARDVEIEIQLAAGISPDKTIDALYAFTDCEVSISPNACIIIENKPHFLGVNDILEISTKNTLDLLNQELHIRKNGLEEKWHFSSLEKIFIENRIYRDIEECETWEAIIETIDNGLAPFKPLLKRDVTVEDINKLTEIKIKRISKFDGFKADELLKGIIDNLEEVENNIQNLIEYAIAYFKNLLDKYGKGKERLTEERRFGDINATIVAVASEKLYANFEEGFVGYGLKKDTYISDCSDIDDIIVIRKDGKYQVSKVSDKAFFGKNIEYASIWRKNDERMVYNVLYLDGKTQKLYAKRFTVTAITRDREYDISQGTPNSKLIYFSANPNGEAEILTIYLHGLARARNKIFDYDFAELAIKGRNSMGNVATKYRIRKVELKEKGKSTIGGRDIWFDPSIGRLNIDGHGQLLGEFNTDDRILVVYKNGEYELTDHEMTNHFEMNEILLIQKFYPKRAITCIHYDESQKSYYVKRFLVETSTINKRFLFINEGKGNKLISALIWPKPIIELHTEKKSGEKLVTEIDLEAFIDVKGWKSIGNKLTYDKFIKWKLLEEKSIQTWVDAKIEEEVDEHEAVDDVDMEDQDPTEMEETDNVEKDENDDDDGDGDGNDDGDNDSTPPTPPEVKPPAKKANPIKPNNEKSSFTSGDQITLL